MRFCQTAPINFRGLRILSLTMAMGLASALGPSNAEAAFKVVGYFPTWAGDVNALPYTKLTHINYAFVLPESNGALKPLDGGASRLQTLVQKRTQRASKSSSQSVDGMTETTPRLSASQRTAATETPS